MLNLKETTQQSVVSAVLFLSLAMGVVLGSACSSRALYSAAQGNQRQACLRLPPAEQSSCMEGLGESFDSYNRQREEVTDK